MTAMEVDVYARISDDQNDDAHGTTNQINECQAYAAERGWTVVDIYRDDSISATTGKVRPGFEAVLNRPIKRALLVWHMDRLIRVSKDLERVIDQGITVHAIQAGLVDLSTPAGKVMARNITAFATYEGELKAQRQIAANKALAAQGKPMWKSAPYGHTTDGKIVETEAAVLREAAQRVLNGESAYQVRTWMQSVPGAPRSHVGRLLTNPRMAGINVYKGERTAKSLIEPIFDEDTFSDLCSILLDPARRTSGATNGKVSSLLTAIARCGVCDDGTTVVTGIGKGNKMNRFLYRCPKRHNQHPRIFVDLQVERATLDLLTGPDAPEVIERHSETPESVREELRELRRQLDEWQALGAELGAVEYMKVTKPLRERVAELEEVARQTSHRALFEGLNLHPDMTIRESYNFQKERGERWRALPLLKQREIVSTLFTVTLIPRDRPRGPASELQQPDKVLIERR